MLTMQRKILIMFRSENKKFVASNVRDKSSKIALSVKKKVASVTGSPDPCGVHRKRLGLRKLVCETSRTIASCEKSVIDVAVLIPLQEQM